MLTQDRLKYLYNYNEFTGKFTRLNNTRGHFAGNAGHVRGDGRVIIKIDGVKYLSSRLAWLYMTGEWPKDQIDHKDMNKGNDAWSNLRPATASQNQGNRHIEPVNSSGLKGVSWCNTRKKWVMAFRRKRRRFDCPAAAHFAYQIEADKHFGEFARNV